MMEKNAKIYVAGHRGMVGSAIVRELKRQGYENIITRTHKELDLCRQEDVEKFFAEEKPEYVFLAAAKVGGIVANQEALADFMYYNMTLEMNVIHSAWQNGCKKLEFLGSSCIYPRMAPQPMPESCLLTSELEKTNEAYALAKISTSMVRMTIIILHTAMFFLHLSEDSTRRRSRISLMLPAGETEVRSESSSMLMTLQTCAYSL